MWGIETEENEMLLASICRFPAEQLGLAWLLALWYLARIFLGSGCQRREGGKWKIGGGEQIKVDWVVGGNKKETENWKRL